MKKLSKPAKGIERSLNSVNMSIKANQILSLSSMIVLRGGEGEDDGGGAIVIVPNTPTK